MAIELARKMVIATRSERGCISYDFYFRMMGTADVPYDEMMMQLDSSTGRYEDAGAQTLGHKGATLAYRKVRRRILCCFFLVIYLTDSIAK